MSILLVLIPVTLLVLGIAVALFFWAVNHQQFDDLDTPAILPLLDDDDPQAQPCNQTHDGTSVTDASHLGAEAQATGAASTGVESPPAST